jgi:erythromycin esterase-like protein
MTGRALEGDEQLQQAIRSTLDSLVGLPAHERFAPLLEQIGDASIVMLGEASYGTHQFQQTRAEITQLLIEEKAFNAVAIEADWVDTYRVHRYVQHLSQDQNAHEALNDFRYFPQWMWRNDDVAQFVEWLREQNQRLPIDARIALYGLDLYSYYGAADAVMNYLDRIDREAAQEAGYRYSCFEQFDQDPQQHGYTAGYGLSPQREEEAIAYAMARTQRRIEELRQSRELAAGDQLYAEEIERLIHKAEPYYREIFHGRNNGWNLRNRHLFDSLIMLINHLGKQNRKAKIVVWTHNAHLGDARFTEMSTRGELNLGQLVKETYADKACAIGFTTYNGTTAAASEWGGQVEQKQIRPALPESYEALFHSLYETAFSLNLHNPLIRERLGNARLERSIGAVYRPQTERISHYFYTQLSQQFDLVLHFDQTDAVIPLETLGD